MLFRSIGTFCYSKVLVEAGQIGEFAAKKEEKSARLKKHCGCYVLLESYQGLQRFSEKKETSELTDKTIMRSCYKYGKTLSNAPENS